MPSISLDGYNEFGGRRRCLGRTAAVKEEWKDVSEVEK